METGHPFSICGNNRQVIGSEDRDAWFGTSCFTDTHSSFPAMMHLSQSQKRQNRGISAHEHLSADLGSRVQLGPGAMSHGGSLSRNFQSPGIEPGNSSFSRLPFNNGIATEGSWNAMSSSLPLQRSLVNSVGSSSNSAYNLVGEPGRNPYKRKSTMDLYPDSSTHAMACGMGDNRYYRFMQVPGAPQPDTSIDFLCDEFGMRRDGQGAYHSVRTNAVPISLHDGLNTPMMQDNYYGASVIQNERGLRRVLQRSDTINESRNMGIRQPETLPLRQGNGVSVASSAHISGTYLGESSSQSGFSENARRFDTTVDGNGLRQGEALDMIGTASVDTGPHPPLRRAMRPALIQQLNSESPHFPSRITPNTYAYLGTINRHLPSFASVQLSERYNNLHNNTVLPTPDLPPLSMPGQLLPRYNGPSRTSFLRQVSIRGQRALQSDGINHQRYPVSHNDLSNQYLAYDWGNTYDEHSDMRLDVDNMSYEELLALEERMGNVNTGVEEGKIQNCLKVTTYSSSDASSAIDSQESDLKCSVCQEEYVEGDEMGELNCGHGYHTDCIKQWLLLKNQCPICKAAASN